MDEIEQALALDVTPASWPVGMGRNFLGCYDLFKDRLVLVERSKGERPHEGEPCEGLEDPRLDELLPDHAVKQLREEVEMARGLMPEFDFDAYREGNMTPVFFGSAINSFGVGELLNGLVTYAPPPRSQPSVEREIAPDEKKVSGFIFKIQANMDPAHHDRIAFLRITSGGYQKGMRMYQVRTERMTQVTRRVRKLSQTTLF